MAKKIQIGDVPATETQDIVIGRRESSRLKTYYKYFEMEGFFNCFYGHSQAGKTTLVRYSIIPYLIEKGYQVIL